MIQAFFTPAALPDGRADAPHAVLVGCAAQKRALAPGELVPARSLYTSDLFRRALAYAEATADEAFIVSAEHGLLELDTPIGAYNRAITELPAPARRAWGERVVAALAAWWGLVVPQLVVLAGEAYAAPLYAPARALGWPDPIEPLRGLFIGPRRRRLAEETAAHLAPIGAL